MIKGSRIMEALLDLLKDGNARTVDMLAIELDTTKIDIKRQLEFLERMGIIRRIPISVGCAPEGGFKNMGEMWEVV